ncbi:hypothetical protein ACHAXT_012617 [Thalassiosira profunda]
MASNTKGSRDADDAARDLTDSLRAGLASDILDAAAKTVGLAQLASKELGPMLGKSLVDAATATMELAQAQLSAIQPKAGGAARGAPSSEAKRDVFEPRAPNPRQAGGQKGTNPQSNVGSVSKKRRTFDANGDSPSNLRRSKVGAREVAKPLPFLFGSTATSATAASSATATSFSFGNVRANLPNGTFVFGANAAVAVASTASSIETPSFAGKRKNIDERSPVDGTKRAPPEALKSRQILKAARRFGKKPSDVSVQSGKKKPSVFASVQLSPTPEAAASAEGKEERANVASKPAFSFAPPSATTPNITGNDGKRDTAERGDYVEEEVLYEVRAGRRKKAGNLWKKYDAGNLRLYRNKQTSNYGMVIRDDLQQIKFHVEVAKGMRFDKEVKETEKGGTVAFVRFAAVADEEKGPEVFLLQVNPKNLDELHEKLEQMAS